MSGVEIVGLILGVFPLILTALEKLNDSTSKKPWDLENHQAEVSTLRLEIQTQHVLFQNSYVKLLLLFLDQRAVVKLLADPEGLLRNGTSISQNIEVHLGEQWPVYKGVVLRIAATVQLLQKHIEKVVALGSNDLDLINRLKALFEQLRFSFSIKQRTGLLKRLKEDNQTLSLLVDQQRTLKSLGHHVSSPTLNNSRGIRERTSELFFSLQETLECSSSCQITHLGSLVLPGLFSVGIAKFIHLEFRSNGQDNMQLGSRWHLSKRSVGQNLEKKASLCRVLGSLKRQEFLLQSLESSGLSRDPPSGSSPRSIVSQHPLSRLRDDESNAAVVHNTEPSLLSSENYASARRTLKKFVPPIHAPSMPASNLSGASRKRPWRSELHNKDPEPQSLATRTLCMAHVSKDIPEEELLALFSSQEGFEALHPNVSAAGVSCRVEYQDVRCATQALKNLYGRNLRPDGESRIRLSFVTNHTVREDNCHAETSLQFETGHRDVQVSLLPDAASVSNDSQSLIAALNATSRDQPLNNNVEHGNIAPSQFSRKLPSNLAEPQPSGYTLPSPRIAAPTNGFPTYLDRFRIQNHSLLHTNKRTEKYKRPEVTVPLSPMGSLRAYCLTLDSVYHASTSVSLSDILKSKSTWTCFPSYFFERDRAKLAATLASSLLVLYDSPWLPNDWSADCILFSVSDGDLDRKGLAKPFTSVELPKHGTLQTKNLPSSSSQISFGIKNQNLYSLGMVLLELLMNAPLASLRQRPDERDTEVAWRLEREVCSIAGPCWADIVSACLHCPWPGSADLADEEFLRNVYAAVVNPLIGLMNVRRLE